MPNFGVADKMGRHKKFKDTGYSVVIYVRVKANW